MAFGILAVRTAEDDDGTLFPLVGNDECVVELEEEDGGEPDWSVATRVEVTQGRDNPKTILQADDIKAQVGYTQARLIFACEKWTKGGGWIGFGAGGIAFALAANAVSKARATHRRKGKILMGHIRFPWIVKVSYMDRRNWASPAVVQVVVWVNEPSGTVERNLNLFLEKGADASRFGFDLAQAAARHRLVHKATLDAEDRRKLETVVNMAFRRNEPKSLLGIWLRGPSYIEVPAPSA